jgi:hypothetical protein
MVSTYRHRFRLERGRVSMTRTTSPTWHSLFSSCAMTFDVRLMIFP